MSADEPKSEPKGIGGWLIVPLIGLILGFAKLGLALLTDIPPIFKEGRWAALTSEASPAYHPLWKTLLIYELAGMALLLVLVAVCLVLFVGKSRRTPPMMIGLMALNVAFVGIDGLLLLNMPPRMQPYAAQQFGTAIAMAISAAIWVPYFLRSKRVKNTFVD